MSEPHLEDLPEAIPLHRVAPAWRALAIVAFLLAGLMVLFIIVMGIVIAGLNARIQATSVALSPPSPGAWPSTTTTTPVPPDAEPDEPAEAVNLPYPVRDDLRPAARRTRPEAEEAATPRDRFLKKGEEIWKCPTEQYLSQVAISPDGQQIAYFQNENLVAGPLGNPQMIKEVGENPPSRASLGLPPMPQERKAAGNRDRQLVGNPLWSADSRYLYYADAGGRLLRYDSVSATVEALPFTGQSPAPLPGDTRIVFVRSHPVVKVETPGMPAGADPTEIVLGDLVSRKLRVVVPQSKTTWSNLVVSPDGKRLAAVSDRGQEGNPINRYRLFVGDLANGKMEPVTPPTGQVGPVCWTPRGKLLIYARTQLPMPPDCWANSDGFFRSTDLFQYDLATKREMRLSRGGGFVSPSLATEGTLYYLAAKMDSNFRARQRVLKMSLATAQRFGTTERELPVRDAAAWTALLERVCKEAKVPANADGAALTPELLSGIAEQFAQTYKELFQEEPPATQTAIDQLVRQELPTLAWDQAQRRQLILVLGAAQGEFLRRKYRAEWQLVPGALTRNDKAEAKDNTAFAFVYNPFLFLQAGDPEEDNDGRDGRWEALDFVEDQAEGRPLILTNDPAAARTRLAKQVDPDLARGTELLQQGKMDEGEKVLLELANRKANQGNRYLALQVGRLLFDHDRKDALRRLMEQRCSKPPRDARQYNLLGLARLDAAPEQAIAAFKKALRCNLAFGPAYLNLAQAYQKAGDPRSARMCLQRYLAINPYGPLAGDAARRLAALDGSKGE